MSDARGELRIDDDRVRVITWTFANLGVAIGQHVHEFWNDAASRSASWMLRSSMSVIDRLSDRATIALQASEADPGSARGRGCPRSRRSAVPGAAPR